MSGNIREIIEIEKRRISEDKKKLNLIKINDEQFKNCDKQRQQQQQQNNNRQQSVRESNQDNKENVQFLNLPKDPPILNKNLPLIDRLELDNNYNYNKNANHNEGALEERKQAFVNKLIHSENPLIIKSDDIKNKMLRYGEYSPNNPQLRVTAAPYLGLGEYEQRRNHYLQKQKADYLEHLTKTNQQFEHCNNKNRILIDTKTTRCGSTKAVQTDIQNIHTRLVQYELDSYNNCKSESSTTNTATINTNHSLKKSSRLEQRLTSAQNALLKPKMDKPKSILSNRRTGGGSPRERHLSELKHTYTPSFLDGFSYQDPAEELERERLKREAYQHELRLQIEEKRRLQAMREEQERREQELENRRLEQQLLRMQEEQMIEEQRRNRRDEMRRHSEDLLRRKHELQTRHLYRKHTDSESSVSNLLKNTNVASASTKALSHYSPPVTRRNPYSFNIPSTSVFSEPPTSKYNMNRYDTYYRKDTLNRMDSLYPYETTTFPRYHNKYNNMFNRYDSLNRIDTLQYQDTLNKLETLSIKDNLSNIQRRHSATQQDLSMLRKSPKLQRRSNSSRFDDTLPIPVLKAHSPVAKELKNSIPFNSNSRHTSSDAVRKLEDKWQIPAVQKNIINHGDPLRDGQNRSILTQLGAIRMQLQQEQLRMDESLRKRNITQSKAVDFL